MLKGQDELIKKLEALVVAQDKLQKTDKEFSEIQKQIDGLLLEVGFPLGIERFILKSIWKQTKIVSNLIAYVDKNKSRDQAWIQKGSDSIDEKGVCMALTLLWHILPRPLFYSLHYAITQWNGNLDSLNEPLTSSALTSPATIHYKTGKELFEVLVSTISYLQHSTKAIKELSDLSQSKSMIDLQSKFKSELEKGFEFISDPNLGRKLVPIYATQDLPQKKGETLSGWKLRNTELFTEDQLTEWIEIMAERPGLRILFGMSDSIEGHVVGFYVNPNGKLEYFNSNDAAITFPFTSAAELSSYIFDNMSNYIVDQYLYMEINSFKIYDRNDKIPETEKVEKVNIKRSSNKLSPNGFNELHLAVLYNDVATISSIIKDNPTLLLKKDYSDRTPFDLALKYNIVGAIHEFLDHFVKTKKILLDFNDELVQKALHIKDVDIIGALIQQNKNKYIKLAAFRLDLENYLVQSGDVDMAQKFIDNNILMGEDVARKIIMSGKHLMLDKLIKSGKIDLKNKNNFITLAMKNDDLNMVNVLVNRGAPIEDRQLIDLVKIAFTQDKKYPKLANFLIKELLRTFLPSLPEKDVNQILEKIPQQKSIGELGLLISQSATLSSRKDLIGFIDALIKSDNFNTKMMEPLLAKSILQNDIEMIDLLIKRNVPIDGPQLIPILKLSLQQQYNDKTLVKFLINEIVKTDLTSELIDFILENKNIELAALLVKQERNSGQQKSYAQILYEKAFAENKLEIIKALINSNTVTEHFIEVCKKSGTFLGAMSDEILSKILDKAIQEKNVPAIQSILKPQRARENRNITEDTLKKFQESFHSEVNEQEVQTAFNLLKPIVEENNKKRAKKHFDYIMKKQVEEGFSVSDKLNMLNQLLENDPDTLESINDKTVEDFRSIFQNELRDPFFSSLSMSFRGEPKEKSLAKEVLKKLQNPGTQLETLKKILKNKNVNAHK